MALLEEVCHRKQAVRFKKTCVIFPVCALLTVYELRCKLLVPSLVVRYDSVAAPSLTSILLEL